MSVQFAARRRVAAQDVARKTVDSGRPVQKGPRDQRLFREWKSCTHSIEIVKKYRLFVCLAERWSGVRSAVLLWRRFGLLRGVQACGRRIALRRWTSEYWTQRLNKNIFFIPIRVGKGGEARLGKLLIFFNSLSYFKIIKLSYVKSYSYFSSLTR